MNPELAGAYAYCERLARTHYENFPVASRLLPARMRPHVAAVYAFARLADDMADEGARPDAARLADLDAWDGCLNAAALGAVERGEPHAEVFLALRHTIEECRLPVETTDRPENADLVSQFTSQLVEHLHRTARNPEQIPRSQDVYEVLDYCRRSANPVGRLVLRIAGHDRPGLDAASDAVCTALQLTNFWQDLEVDWTRGRLYVPGSIWQPAGAREDDLTARRLTPAWREALGDVAARTRALFQAGAPVCDGVSGRLRWELRATWLGGVRILDKLAAADFDVFAHRPSLGGMDAPVILWRAATWARRGH